MINFRLIYEKIFNSFDISADTKFIEELEKDWIEKIMIIKRSRIFGVFISRMFLIILILMIWNSYLIYLNFSKELYTAYILIGLLIFNILYWIISVLLYFKKFSNIYWRRPQIIETKNLKELLKLWDKAFEKFFNQTIFNYFILIWVVIYICYDLVFWQWITNVWALWITNIILLIAQIHLSSKFKKKMCDLEMDFSLIMPGKVIFYNQSWLLRNILTINSEKIKTITSNFGSFIWSVFNYWNIVVMTEGDSEDIWEMKLFFISHPTETVYEINELLWKKAE